MLPEIDGAIVQPHQVEIWAYCLMPNHVHLIAVPQSADGLRRAIGEAHRRYTRMVNFRERWRGHLWQGRFASFVLDEPYLLTAVRYVELNPSRGAGQHAEPLSVEQRGCPRARTGRHACACRFPHVIYLAVGNSFWSFKAFRTASLSAGPRRFMARTRPSGAIRNVAGIARMRYVSATPSRIFPPYT